MARPEGFEPPTPRSVVRSNPQRAAIVEGKSSFYEGFSPFLLYLNICVFRSVWKQNGNNKLTLMRCKTANRYFGSCASTPIALPDDAANRRKGTIYPQIYRLPACQIVFVSMMFPDCSAEFIHKLTGREYVSARKPLSRA